MNKGPWNEQEQKHGPVEPPEFFDLLSDDLNQFSERNRLAAAAEAAAQEAQANAEAEGAENIVKTLLSMQSASVVGRPRGRHVYLIGRRFDPWKEWKGPNPPMPLRRICNIGALAALAPAARSRRPRRRRSLRPRRLLGLTARS